MQIDLIDVITAIIDKVNFNIHSAIFFLNDKNNFYTKLNECSINEVEELTKMGKDLNIKKEKLISAESNIKELNSFNSFDDKTYILAISELLTFLPKGYADMILKNSFKVLSMNIKDADECGIDNIYKIIYSEVDLINDIFKYNGEYGLVRYYIYNRRLNNNCKLDLLEMYIDNSINKECILNLTSSNYEKDNIPLDISSDLKIKTHKNNKIISL